ncbi:MAG: hypothetical protein AB1898_06340 [Acidobacteriota bacterium]
MTAHPTVPSQNAGRNRVRHWGLALLVVTIGVGNAYPQGEIKPIPLTSPGVRMVRWEGGPLEAKRRQLLGTLTGDQKELLQAIRKWYQPDQFEFLLQGGINWVWVTWSVGLSAAEEQKAWASLKPALSRFRGFGIGVLATVSAGQLFAAAVRAKQDDRVLKGKDGLPVPCRKGLVPEDVDLSCFQSDLAGRTWKETIAWRSRKALAEGASGVVLQGLSASTTPPHLLRRFLEDLAWEIRQGWPQAAVIVPGDLGTAAFFADQPLFVLNDGVWPGVQPSSAYVRDGDVIVAGASQGPWIDSNAWLFNLAAAYAGERPIFLNLPATQEPQLNQSTTSSAAAFSVLEAFAFGANVLLDVSDRLRLGLFKRETSALQEWASVANALSFLSRLKGAYRGRPAAEAAVLVDTAEDSAEILNLLSRRGIEYVVQRADNLGQVSLDSFPVVVAVNLRPHGKPFLSDLAGLAERGKTVVSTPPNGPESVLGERPLKESLPEGWIYSVREGRWILLKEPVTDPNAFASNFKNWLPEGTRTLRMWNAPAVLGRVFHLGESNETAVHLINYGRWPVEELQLRVKGAYQKAEFHSPEAAAPEPLSIVNKDGFAELTLPRLEGYGLIHLQN